MNDERLDAEALRAALEARAHADAEDGEAAVDLAEIWAYVSGSLPAEDAAETMDRIVRDPEAARLAVRLASFQAERGGVPQADDETGMAVAEVLSEEEVEADWRKLSRRVGIEAPTVTTAAAGPDSASRHAPVVPIRRWFPSAVAAAVVVLTLATGFLARNRLATERRAPRLNVQSIEVWEDATRRGAAEPVEVPDDAAFNLLILKLVPGDEGPYPLAYHRHALEIWPQQGWTKASPLWRTTDVRLEDDLTVTLEISRGFLKPGSYELRLLGLDGATERVLATFAIEIP